MKSLLGLVLIYGLYVHICLLCIADDMFATVRTLTIFLFKDTFAEVFMINLIIRIVPIYTYILKTHIQLPAQ